MFRFFRNDEGVNPIAALLGNLSENQKMSIVNLLLAVAVSDEGSGDEDKEMDFLNNYVNILGVRSAHCMDYLQKYGQDRIGFDLRNLNHQIKEFLVVATWDLINCDGRANDVELSMALTIFESMGIDENDFVSVIEKSQNVLGKFNQ